MGRPRSDLMSRGLNGHARPDDPPGHSVSVSDGSDERVDLLRQLPVLFGDDIACTMGGQADLHGIVDIGPGRMMIHLLRRQRDTRHKRKGL